MDGLTEFILRELAFEAGLGFDISQLSKLISQYYAILHPEVLQTVDDKLCTFVWSLLAAREDVIVGRTPDDAVPVHFPPQIGGAQKGKGRATNEEAASLIPLHCNEQGSTSLDALVTKYGTELRIAVTPETRFQYLTGSHVRPTRLSGTAYAVLQLITRTRREGISPAEVSKQSGYSPKDCFALLQTLVELGHIYKIRVGGSVVNICIHREFYDDECEWKQAEKEAMGEPRQGDGSRLTSVGSDAEEEEAGDFKRSLQFERIDNRHLSNIQVVKPRLERLLQHMPNGVHPYRNLLFALGFDTSNRKERRVFTHRIHELISARFIEKVWAPSTTSSTRRVLCVRLVTDDPTLAEDMDLAEDGAGDENDPTEDAVDVRGEAAENVLAEYAGVNATRSIAHRIIAMIDESGTTGMTIAEISKQLHNFDLRSITNLTARFKDSSPPTHLADRGLVIRTETYGREKRQRLFTNAAYLTMVEQDHLEDRAFNFTAEDLARAEAWAPFHQDEFSINRRAREDWIQEFVRRTLDESGQKTRRGTKGKKQHKNPLDANGKPIIGRPRKDWKTSAQAEKGNDPPKKRGRPPKRKAEEVEEVDPPVPKKRGRPRKAKPAPIEGAMETSTAVEGIDEPVVDNSTTSAPEPVMRAKPSATNTATDLHVDIASPRGEPSTESHANGVNEAPVSAVAGSDEHSANPRGTVPKERRSARLKNQTMEAVEPPVTVTTSQPSASLANTRRDIDSNRPSKRARLASRPGSTDAQEAIATQRPSNPQLDQPAASLDGVEQIEGLESQSARVVQQDGESAVMRGTSAELSLLSQSSVPSGSRQGRPANVSSLRRQTEFLQVLETMGGVVNISLARLFTDEHQKLLERLHVSGNAVSGMPGTGMDRRTFSSTINALETGGFIKTRAVSTVTPLGTVRRANIIHLPNASMELIEACIEKFRASTSSGKGSSIHNDYPTLPEVTPLTKAVRNRTQQGPRGARSPSLPLSPAPTLAQPQDPLMVARLTHLAEPMTSAQYFGYLAGRFSRARALHLQLLSELVASHPIGTLVSPTDKVFSKDYFFEALPISTYCAIVPVGSVLEGLKDLLESEAGSSVRLLDAPETVRKHLRPRSSANRSRMQKVLSTLVGLGCLVPVRLQSDTTGQSQNYVDAVEDTTWDFLKVAEHVPIYRFADKDLGAPFCGNRPVSSVDAAIHLWEQLRAASHPTTCHTIQCFGSGAYFSGDPKLLRSIRRNAEWESEYVLSNDQVDHLYSLIDVTTGHTPLDDQNSTRFDNACYITAAPAGAVTAFFSRKRADIQQELERARQKVQNQAHERRRLEEQARQALATKAAKAKIEQESRWQDLVARALDGRSSQPLVQKALTSLKSAYMLNSQVATDSAWEVKIREVVRDATGAKQFVIAPPAPESSRNTSNAQQEPDADVSTLILRQGQPITQKDIAPKKSGRKSKKQLEAENKKASETPATSDADSRRRRFPWNPEYDELARDAGAIIRVRCQGKRMDWSALEQVFPGVQRNSVRQRISNLETLPGAAAYFRRLDDAWAALWLQHRGSEALPDPNPDSIKDFDLPTHVTFLRQSIDKAALRVGTDAANLNTGGSSFVLTGLEELHTKFTIKELPSGSSSRQPTSWDFYFDVTSEEPRERESLNHPFILYDGPPCQDETPLVVSVAKAAIKMVISTPTSSYDSNDAARILSELGEDVVKSAVADMKDSLDMRRTRPDKREPGRKFQYSDLELLRLKGDFASSMYPDAASMRESLKNLQPEEYMDIGLTDEDGEIAAFLQLVSENKLDINIDTSNPRVGREQLGSQSKKVDDENLEAQLTIRLKPSDDQYAETRPDTEPAPIQHVEPPCEHALSGGPNDDQCIHAGERLSEPNQIAAARALYTAGPLGLTIPSLLELANGCVEDVLQILSALTESSPPLAYVLGYDRPRAISAFYLSHWTVQVPVADQPRPKMFFPRRWLSIHGNLIESVWTMALRTVAGAFMYRPRVSEYSLRARYLGLFDRQELDEILMQLLTDGKLKRVSSSVLPLGMGNVEDEKSTYWTLSNDSTWF